MKDLLAQLVDGEPLSEALAVDAFAAIMDGEAEPAQTGALLTAIAMRGATTDEMVGAARVMRERARRVDVPDGLVAIDTCGTGGDHAGTFNISTAAALVAAAAGRPEGLCVAKHGNRSVTSKSGSSQVLETLGVTLAVDDATLTRCLDEAGICFCFAPAHHPAMKHAAPVRAALGFRTLFNLVGPLTNPAGARRQLMGVYDPKLTEPLAEVLQRLGAVHAMVVHGEIPGGGHTVSGLDELSTCGTTRVTELRDDAIRTFTEDATALGLPFSHPSSLRVDGPDASAALIRKVLDGQHGPARDIVCLNAAAALVVGGAAGELREGVEAAADVIDSGAAAKTLETLVALTADG